MNLILPYVGVFVSALVLFAALDLIWIGLVMRDFYRQGIGHLMGERLKVKAGFALYTVYTIGLMFFAISPAIITGSLMGAAILGGLYGFFTYATYNLTNLATLRDWPLKVTLLDIGWGFALSLTVSMAAFSLSTLLL